MEDNSSVLFVSSDNSKSSDDIIKLLLNDCDNVKNCDNMNVYSWHIVTKYYECDVNLCSLKSKSLEQELRDGVEGVVMFFDCECPDWERVVDGWLPFLREYDPEIKILLTDKVNDEILKNQVLEWCLKEEFELVELSGVSEDEDFPETVGIDRVKQALHAHMWPKLELKERKEPTKLSDLLSGVNIDNLSVNSEIAHYLNDVLEQDSSEMNFESLFSSLMAMKQKAEGMEGERRKDFAEKVVTAYWNAIGGDSDELSDSDVEYDEFK